MQCGEDIPNRAAADVVGLGCLYKLTSVQLPHTP
jgi:hypothetical protein